MDKTGGDIAIKVKFDNISLAGQLFTGRHHPRQSSWMLTSLPLTKRT
jgi:hypothetical protein